MVDHEEVQCWESFIVSFGAQIADFLGMLKQEIEGIELHSPYICRIRMLQFRSYVLKIVS